MRTSYALPVCRVRRRFAGHGLSLALLCALSVPVALPSAARAQGIPAVVPSAAHAQAARPGDRGFSVDGNPAVDMPEDHILVSIDAKNASFATLIHLLMEQGHVSYTLDQKLMTAQAGNVILRKIPFHDALDAVLKISNVAVTYQVNYGIYRIIPRSNVEAQPTTTATAAAEANNLFNLGVQAGAAGYDKRDPAVSIGVSDVTLYDALKMVFGQAHVNYTLDPALRAIRVSVAMSNVPLRIAVDTLLKTVSNNTLTLRVENGIYKVAAIEGADASPAIKP